MKVVIIGGGVSGIFAAISAAKSNNEVTILEKTLDIGNKLKITGKGRCNITFDGDLEYFTNNIVVNNKFIYSSFNNFSNYDTLEFLNSLGIKTKLERGNRYFLQSDDASELVHKLKSFLKKLNVNIIYNCDVLDIKVVDNCVYSILTKNKEYICDKCIVSTGGMSYKKTGSDGSFFDIIKKLGHNIIDLKPALVGLKADGDINLSGMNLKNVVVDLYNNDKKIYSDFGEMLFSHFGVTGPTILSLSSILTREKINNPYILVDLKSSLSDEVLDKRICRDLLKYSNLDIKNGLKDLLLKNLIPVILDKCNIDKSKKCNSITIEERKNLVYNIHKFKINILGFMPIDTAIITAGGVDTKQINPKTLESKLIHKLFFCGEVIDIDALTGGFNLQIAISTGVAAGK
ncbi:MAG: NAD(P)/FAD-dependent oxidoreductase [Clostridia bacterium]